MDTTKWKSILVPIDIYHRIREIAQLEHRPIGSQLRLIFSEWLEYRHQMAQELPEEGSSDSGETEARAAGTQG
jgi:hypothetical protein